MEDPDQPEPVRHARRFADDKVDFDTVKIVRRLRRYGHQAYLVGGCVRDLLLERTPKDFDVATSARPRQVKRLFRNCRIIGRRFKLAHIHFGEKIIEVATFRKNPTAAGGNGSPGDDAAGANGGGSGSGEGNGNDDDLLITRDNVFGSAAEDAERRDFTINALFYDVEEGVVVDYVGGMDDIERRRLDTIGVPETRFREDPVRILRAAEFSARLDFHIDDEVADAMETCGADIERAATPRVLEEILQALSCGRAEQVFRTLIDLHLLEHVVPEIGDMEDVDGFLRDLRCVDEMDGGRRDLSDAHLLTFLMRMRTREEEELFAADASRPMLNPLEPLERVFGPFGDRMGVSRKNAQRVREIYLGLRKLRGEGRRRFKPTTLVRRAHFPETLRAFEIACHADDLPLDEYKLWRERLDRYRSEAKQRSNRPKSRGSRPRR